MSKRFKYIKSVFYYGYNDCIESEYRKMTQNHIWNHVVRLYKFLEHFFNELKKVYELQVPISYGMNDSKIA